MSLDALLSAFDAITLAGLPMGQPCCGALPPKHCSFCKRKEISMNRDLSIIAQNAGTTAANLLSTFYGDASPDVSIDEFVADFEAVRGRVFEGILKLASESAVTVEDVVREFPGATTEAPASGGANGSYKFTTGKHAGRTIAEVAADPKANGYLEYYAENGKQENVVRAVKSYLAAA